MSILRLKFLSKTLLAFAVIGAIAWADPAGSGATAASSLRQLSLKDLRRIEVSTGSRKTETWWTSPGVNDVVTDTNKGTPKDHPQNEIAGANLTANWEKPLALDSDLRVVAYYDTTAKSFIDPFDEKRHAVSGSLKYHRVRDRHDSQIGADAQVSWDRIMGGAIFLDRAERMFCSTSIYLQDTIALVPRRWSLILGAQALHTNFSGVDVQPTIRLAWTPSPRTTLRGAVSRAVRTPVRLDRDLMADFGTVRAFEANENVKSESVLALEIGWRQTFGARLAVGLATFVNDYDDVRSYESATTMFRALPWTFKNTTNVRSSGFELMALAQPMARLFLKGIYRYLDFNLTKDPGSGDFQNGFHDTNDPRHVAALTARLDLLGARRDLPAREQPAESEGERLHDRRRAARVGVEQNLGGCADRLQPPRSAPPRIHDGQYLNNEVGRSVTFKATCRC